LTDLVTKGTTPTSIGHAFVEDGINFVKVESITTTGQFIEEKFAHITPACHAVLGRSQLQAGDILFSIAGALGRTGFVTDDILPANTNQALAIIRLKRDVGLLPKFVLKALETGVVLEQIEKFKGGVAQQNLSLAQVRDFQIALPPLAEQQRIVGLLDEAFEGLATAKANAEKNLQNARALFESHLQSVFTQRGPGWVETTVGEIGKVSMCKRIFKEETTATGDIPFYKIGTFGKEPDAFIPNQTYNEYRAKYSFPKKGDVLISASGTIGRRVRYDGEPAYFQDSNIVWIDNDEKHALNDYLFHFYGACEWNSSKGATILRLYNDDLRRIAIGFPKSLQEQRQIVGQLDVLEAETQRLARLYERKHAALVALKKSLLHQAFTGAL
jgi:type I restriction enzyme S subunit